MMAAEGWRTPDTVSEYHWSPTQDAVYRVLPGIGAVRQVDSVGGRFDRLPEDAVRVVPALADEPSADAIEKLASAIYSCDANPPLNARTVPDRWAVYQAQARNILWPVVRALLGVPAPTKKENRDAH